MRLRWIDALPFGFGTARIASVFLPRHYCEALTLHAASAY